jgi:hypothetical protein
MSLLTIRIKIWLHRQRQAGLMSWSCGLLNPTSSRSRLVEENAWVRLQGADRI